MKMRFLAGVAFAFLLPMGAQAADLSYPVKAPPVVVLAFSWTGFYIGGHVGYGWGKEHDNQSGYYCYSAESCESPLPADSFDVDGFIGGGHVGYNWQSGQFVFGVEGDLDYADISGSQNYEYGPYYGKLSFESDWQGSVRLRAGYAVDNLLLYATGGVAFGHGKLRDVGTSDICINAGPCDYGYSDDNTHIGWTIGGGGEYAFTPNWIGRVEVRYTDFGSETYKLDPEDEYSVKADWNQVVVNVGLSYKF